MGECSVWYQSARPKNPVVVKLKTDTYSIGVQKRSNTIVFDSWNGIFKISGAQYYQHFRPLWILKCEHPHIYIHTNIA